MIQTLAGQGYEAKRCCRILGVAPSGYFEWRRGELCQSELRRQWLKEVISQIYARSKGTYGYRRVRAELKLGCHVSVSRKLVYKLMHEQNLKDLPTLKGRKNLVNLATTEDLVCRDFSRPGRLIGDEPAINLVAPGSLIVHSEPKELPPSQIPTRPFETAHKAKFTWIAKNNQSSGTLAEDMVPAAPNQIALDFKLTKFQLVDGLVYARSTDSTRYI